MQLNMQYEDLIQKFYHHLPLANVLDVFFVDCMGP